MADPSYLSRPPIVLRGIPASPGIGIGKAFVLKEEALVLRISRSLGRKVTKCEKEIQRFRQGSNKTRVEIDQTRDKSSQSAG